MPQEKLLAVPHEFARRLLEAGGFQSCPLLNTRRFVKFCADRGYDLNEKRLKRFEKLGLFAPIFKATIRHQSGSVALPPTGAYTGWFEEAGFVETLTNFPPPSDYEDDEAESYYSVFQIHHLSVVLSATTLSIQVDQYFDGVATGPIDWQERMDQHIGYMKEASSCLTPDGHRQGVAALCQFISNRYYPHTQGDQRTIRVSANGIGYSDDWISIFDRNWTWRKQCREWDANEAENLFQLTPEKLRHAYEGLSSAQDFCDPLSNWYQLKQFVSLDQRKRLKDKALRAETFLEGALMLRRLFKDLYNEDLPPPDEVHRQVLKYIPELEARNDTRRYLEFTANLFGVNPQPKAVIMVEGATEEYVLNTIFQEYYGVHPGRLGIEIINLWGVGTATGSRRDDRFRAIIRLMDYLHHHQTYTFLILDNENYAQKLKAGISKATSTYKQDKYVTRPEYIKIWKDAFEFDNFSCTEIAAAMNEVVGEKGTFARAEVINISKLAKPGSALSKLYRERTGCDLPKLELADALCRTMLDPDSRRAIQNRPITKFLNRVELLTARNYLPTSQEMWVRNQDSRFLRQSK